MNARVVGVVDSSEDARVGQAAWMGLTMRQRKAVLASQVKAWKKATKQEKSVILDHLVAVNGWHRDHARKMMRAAVAGQDVNRPRKTRVPVYRYGPEVIDALVLCWAVLDGPTGKILRPALPVLVASLVACDELGAPPLVIDGLLAMSAATIDRRLRPLPDRAGRRVEGPVAAGLNPPVSRRSPMHGPWRLEALRDEPPRRLRIRHQPLPTTGGTSRNFFRMSKRDLEARPINATSGALTPG